MSSRRTHACGKPGPTITARIIAVVCHMKSNFYQLIMKCHNTVSSYTPRAPWYNFLFDEYYICNVEYVM